jgi:hypothetical protein
MMDDFGKMFERAEDYADETKQLFLKMNDDRCEVIPEVGDTIVMNARLLGMGFDWIRYSGTCLAVGQNSYYVEFHDRMNFDTRKPERKWVHPAVVTDVIRKVSQ